MNVSNILNVGVNELVTARRNFLKRTVPALQCTKQLSKEN